MGFMINCLIVLCAIVEVVLVNGTVMKCKQIDDCSCRFTDGTILNITALGNKDGSPRFDYVPGPAGRVDMYAYNPCFGFTRSYGSCVNDTAVCGLSDGTGSSDNLGTQSSTIFRTTELHIELNYYWHKQWVPPFKTHSSVTLVCDMLALKPKFVAHGPTGELGNYTFTLTTVCACPDGCVDGVPTPAPTTPGLSTPTTTKPKTPISTISTPTTTSTATALVMMTLVHIVNLILLSKLVV